MPELKGLVTASKGSEFHQVIDVGQVLDVDTDINRDLLERFGQAVLDHITSRTKKGIDVNGNKFKGYDADYVASDDFKAYGKQKSKINLTQKGDMLAQMDLLKIEGNKIFLGWDDDTERAKAYNNHVGDTLPSRPFFGATRKQLDDIKQDFIDDVKKIDENKDKNKDFLQAMDIFSAARKAEPTPSNSLLNLFLGDDNDGLN